MRYRRLQTLGFAALLATITAIHCLPTEAQADRRRRWTTYGSDRGRLVVACDMRSDTCSDGRRITTVRATPVPCETSPGVWEIVPANQGCYGVRGLESWDANTSYLSWGAELDRSPWLVDANNSLTALPGGGYRLCQLEGAASNSGLRQNIGAPGAVFTLAGIGQATTGTAVTIGAYSVFTNPPHALPERWGQFSLTGTPGAGRTVFAYPRPAGPGQCIDLRAFWLTQTSTPGRPCWGGEAPVTCARDQHTISTEGWPTEAGEILIELRDVGTADVNRYIWGRLGAGSTGQYLSIRVDGSLQMYSASFPVLTSPALEWEAGARYSIRVRRTRDGLVSIWRDGLMLVEGTRPPFYWGSSVSLGTEYNNTGHLNGSISSLRVRSFE